MPHREFACATEGCGHIICLTAQHEQRLRRTHETFVCPAGHRQGFYDESDDEKTIRLLRRQLNQAWARVSGWQAQARYMRDELRFCPLDCGFRVKRVWTPDSIRARMATHLVDVHGAEFVEAEDEARAA